MVRHSARSALAVLAAGAALVAAGCSADSSPPQKNSSQQSAETGTAAPGTADTASRASGTPETGSSPGGTDTAGSTEPSTASAPPWCTTSTLTPAFRPLESAAGSRYTALVLSNTSTTACRTQGWPGLQLAGADGEPLPTDAVRDRSRSPQPVTLEPGERAWSRLHWSVVAGEEDPADGRCPAPETVRVTPPDQHKPDSADWGGLGTVCGGGRIDVLPLSEGSGPGH